MEIIYLFLIFKIFVLLFMFQIKHFLADYPLQNEYMLGKFKDKWDWIKPLGAHCGVHATFSFFILYVFCPWLTLSAILTLSILDMVIHFIMDRIKASPNLLGRFQSLTKNDFIMHKDEIDYLKIFEESHPKEAKEKIEIKEKLFNIRKKENKYFWWALGLDQMVHHLTHYLIVFIAIAIYLFG